MKQKTLAVVMAVAIVLSLATPVLANPPYPEANEPTGDEEIIEPFDPRTFTPDKWLNQPSPKDYARIQERRRLIEAGQLAEANALDLTGTDRVLVILVEFGGPDVFTWTAPTIPMSYTTGSQWDPLGIADPDENTGNRGDCTLIQQKIEATLGYTLAPGAGVVFTYTGPLHNMIERPHSTTDRSGNSIWTDDFTPEWFEDFMFGNGVEISYTMQSAESMYASFLGQSVTDYFADMSGGTYTVTGDVVGWLQVPHSTWYYDTDECPGSRSGMRTSRGAIPEGGTSRDLAQDALDAVNAISDTIPGFDWADYDLDGDGIIDRLWIVHAGYGEEDGTVLLNRDPTDPLDPTRTITVPEAFYGEAAVWSHSSGGFFPPYSVTLQTAAGPYIMMPENGGIGVFAHESGHNIGAIDLYCYGNGDTSAGFWTLMADDWTGHPIGFEPPALDAWHLDYYWGWLDPYVVDDPTQCHEVTIGQASRFEENSATGDVYRGVKIPLPDGSVPPVVDAWQGEYYWWSGLGGDGGTPHNAMMTLAEPLDLSGTTAVTLTFDMAYDIEDGGWDFVWVQVSTMTDTWPYTDTLTNGDTQCATDPGWIGGSYGFPDDLCAAGIGGFYGHNLLFPDPETQVFDLSAYAGQEIYLRFWYMSDWFTFGEGAFIDSIMVEADGGTIFADDAEVDDSNWVYEGRWVRQMPAPFIYPHNFYLQWRNVNDNGGYDSALGEERWRFGPANSGLLVWYNNDLYNDTEIDQYLAESPSFGPKGRALVIDSHPYPYMNPYETPSILGAESVNLPTRGLMRDATFTLLDTVDFTYTFPYQDYVTPTHYTGRPAVSTFEDAMGYYPGFDNTGGLNYWGAIDWDSSTVVPAKGDYGVAATAGYPGTAAIMYIDDQGWFFAPSWPGGTGNPGDYNLQFGWQVELIEEAADHTWGKVRICNQQPLETAYEPMAISAAGVHFFTYTVTLNNAGTMTQTHWFTFTLDPNLTFVSASWMTGTLAFPTYGWTGDILGGESLEFTLVASMTVDSGHLETPGTDITTLFEHNDFMNPVYVEDMVTHVEGFYIFLPVVMKQSDGTAAFPP
jgi:immune inhibitor A